MSEIQELKLDVDEAKSLLATASRKRIKDLLTIEISKLETKVKGLESVINNEPTKNISTNSHFSVIRNYSWDQSDKFLKLYITLPSVHNLDKEKVTCDFGSKNFHLKVLGLNGVNYELKIILAHPINAEKSYIKVKTDMLVIFASKKSETKWEVVTSEEKRIQEIENAKKPNLDQNSDPSSGIMDMMKKMYEEGDDEMKRMLNKTWYESQQKKMSGELDAGNLDL